MNGNEARGCSLALFFGGLWAAAAANAPQRRESSERRTAQKQPILFIYNS